MNKTNDYIFNSEKEAVEQCEILGIEILNSGGVFELWDKCDPDSYLGEAKNKTGLVELVNAFVNNFNLESQDKQCERINLASALKNATEAVVINGDYPAFYLLTDKEPGLATITVDGVCQPFVVTKDQLWLDQIPYLAPARPVLIDGQVQYFLHKGINDD